MDPQPGSSGPSNAMAWWVCGSQKLFTLEYLGKEYIHQNKKSISVSSCSLLWYGIITCKYTMPVVASLKKLMYEIHLSPQIMTSDPTHSSRFLAIWHWKMTMFLIWKMHEHTINIEVDSCGHHRSKRRFWITIFDSLSKGRIGGKGFYWLLTYKLLG